MIKLILAFVSQGVMDFCSNEMVAVQTFDYDTLKAFHSRLSDLESVDLLSLCPFSICINQNTNTYKVVFGDTYRIVFTQNINPDHVGFLEPSLINRIKIIEIDKDV